MSLRFLCERQLGIVTALIVIDNVSIFNSADCPPRPLNCPS